MAKRFISTDLFQEDWFLEIDTETKLFWIYVLTNCDHAGFFKVNLRVFNALNGTGLEADDILTNINAEKRRIKKLTERLWFIPDFILFQYGQNLNPNNRAHLSVLKLLEKNGIEIDEIKGLSRSLNDFSKGLKDKDKDKDKETDGNIKSEHQSFKSFTAPTEEEVKSEFRSALTRNGLPLDAFGDIEKVAESFFNHYESQGWIRSNGMKVFKFRPLVQTWILTEKSKPRNSNQSSSETQYSWNS